MQIERIFGHALKLGQPTFGVSPEALDAVDVRTVVGELVAAVVDTRVPGVAHVDQAEAAMTPGAAFGALGEGYVRMALVENEQRIRQALRQLERVIGAAPTATV